MKVRPAIFVLFLLGYSPMTSKKQLQNPRSVGDFFLPRNGQCDFYAIGPDKLGDGKLSTLAFKFEFATLARY